MNGGESDNVKLVLFLWALCPTNCGGIQEKNQPPLLCERFFCNQQEKHKQTGNAKSGKFSNYEY